MWVFSTSFKSSASFKCLFISSAWIIASFLALTSSSGVLTNGYGTHGGTGITTGWGMVIAKVVDRLNPLLLMLRRSHPIGLPEILAHCHWRHLPSLDYAPGWTDQCPSTHALRGLLRPPQGSPLWPQLTTINSNMLLQALWSIWIYSGKDNTPLDVMTSTSAWPLPLVAFCLEVWLFDEIVTPHRQIASGE